MSGPVAENDASSLLKGSGIQVRSVRDDLTEARRRLVAESLQVGNPTSGAPDLPDRADPVMECQIELPVEDIRPYEHNPRRTCNPRFAEIKDSIRASGIRVPLTVTRRPGESHFVVEAGGNTRLAAVQELWAETRDARFARLVVVYRPWRSECHVLTSHLIENEQRGEMTFWDKATGIVALKARIEAEGGQVLSLRQLEDALRRAGLAANTATLSLYLFATERLNTIGAAVPQLSGLDVKTLQPRLNALRRHAQARTSMSEAELYAAVFEPVFRQTVETYVQSRRFDVAEVCAACEEALAGHLDEPVEQLRGALASSPRPMQSAGPALRLLPPPASSAPGDAPGGAVRTADSNPSDRTEGARVLPNRDGDGRSGRAVPGLVDKILAFAALAGIEAYVRAHAAAPRGYYMDTLGSGDASVAAKRRAWCVLAAVAGQSDTSTAGEALDAPFFGWLTDANDDSANALWHVLSMARARGESGRLPCSDADNAPSTEQG